MKNLANRLADNQIEKMKLDHELEEALCELGFDQWNDWSTDYYDMSIEFYVPRGFELTVEQEKFLQQSGFARCWLKYYPDGTEKSYYWPKKETE